MGKRRSTLFSGCQRAVGHLHTTDAFRACLVVQRAKQAEANIQEGGDTGIHGLGQAAATAGQLQLKQGKKVCNGRSPSLLHL